MPGQAALALRSVADQAMGDASTWLRSALLLAKQAGCVGITLDVTLPGFRPRDLDASARRELAVLVRRHDLALLGLDCFVPKAHLQGPEQARAVDALCNALLLLSDLRRHARVGASPVVGTATGLGQPPHALCVACATPSGLASDVAQHLSSVAREHALVLADSTLPSPLLASQRKGSDADDPLALGAGTCFVPSVQVASSQQAVHDALLACPALAQARLHAPSGGPLAIDPQTYLALLRIKRFAAPIIVENSPARA
jgi:hypothetical protein